MQSSSRRSFIIGIAGGSGAGKDRVIDHYLAPVLGDDLQIIEHDWYYHEAPHLYAAQGVTKRDRVNYDRPDAYENELLAAHLYGLHEGKSYSIRPYSKQTGMRDGESILLEPRRVIVVDGMMVLAVDELRHVMDLRAYVHADEALRLQRRVLRDLWFSSEQESTLRFYRDVMPAHRQFVEPSRQYSDFELTNNTNGAPPEGLEAFLDAVRQAVFV